jgi:flavin-binding protein dodecin
MNASFEETLWLCGGIGACSRIATLRNLRWFEVIETRGQIDDGKIQPYQVTLKVGFTKSHS